MLREGKHSFRGLPGPLEGNYSGYLAFGVSLVKFTLISLCAMAGGNLLCVNEMYSSPSWFAAKDKETRAETR